MEAPEGPGLGDDEQSRSCAAGGVGSGGAGGGSSIKAGLEELEVGVGWSLLGTLRYGSAINNISTRHTSCACMMYISYIYL